MWRKNTTLKLHLILRFFRFISCFGNYRFFFFVYLRRRLSSSLFIRSRYLCSTRLIRGRFTRVLTQIKSNNTLSMRGCVFSLCCCCCCCCFLVRSHRDECKYNYKKRERRRERMRDATMTKYTEEKSERERSQIFSSDSTQTITVQYENDCSWQTEKTTRE